MRNQSIVRKSSVRIFMKKQLLHRHLAERVVNDPKRRNVKSSKVNRNFQSHVLVINSPGVFLQRGDINVVFNQILYRRALMRGKNVMEFVHVHGLQSYR